MSLRVNFNHVMGTMTLVQKQGEQICRFKLDICECNALAAFIYNRKDANGEKWCDLMCFFADRTHATRILKNGHFFNSYNDPSKERATNISLNLAYKQSKAVMELLTKYGYKVNVYYKPINK